MADFEQFDYSVLDERKAEYIYKESKDFLQNTIDAVEGVQAKSFQLLGFLFAVISALVGFVFVRFEAFSNSKTEVEALLLTAILMLLLLSFSFWKITKNLYPKEFFSTGNQPKNLLRKDFCEQDYYLMLLGECRNYEDKIARNIAINTENSARLKCSANLAIATIIGSPIAALAIFSLLQYCS